MRRAIVVQFEQSMKMRSTQYRGHYSKRLNSLRSKTWPNGEPNAREKKTINFDVLVYVQERRNDSAHVQSSVRGTRNIMKCQILVALTHLNEFERVKHTCVWMRKLRFKSFVLVGHTVHGIRSPKMGRKIPARKHMGVRDPLRQNQAKLALWVCDMWISSNVN